MAVNPKHSYYVIKSMVNDRYWNIENKLFETVFTCTKFKDYDEAMKELINHASYERPAHLINVIDKT